MPFDEGTGRGGIYRGKPPPSKADAIQKQLQKNRMRLRGLDNKRHTTIRVLAAANLTANTPVGVEGELVTDGTTSMWIYLDGTWQRTRCFGIEGPIPPSGTIVMVGYEDDITYQQDVFTVDTDGSREPVQVTDIPKGEDINEEPYRTIWIDETHDEFYAIFSVYSGAPRRGYFKRYRADGTLLDPEVYSFEGDHVASASSVVRTDDGDVYWLTYDMSEGDQYMRIHNITTGTMVDSFKALDIDQVSSGYSPYEETVWAQLNYQGTKVHVFINYAGGDPNPYGGEGYVCDLDGSNAVRILRAKSVPPYTDGDTTSYGAYWNHSGTKLVYHGPSPGAPGLGLVDPDGTNKGLIWTTAETYGPGTPRFAPNDSMIAFTQNPESVLHVISTTPPYEEIQSFSILPFSTEWDWSPDGTKIFTHEDDEDPKFYLCDIETGAKELIFDTSAEPFIYFWQICWGRRRG